MRIGTRKSELALKQTDLVLYECQNVSSETFEIVQMSTKGDEILNQPLHSIGKSLFTKELENALLQNQVDFVVHSCKDISSQQPKGLKIGAFLKREFPHDAVVMKEGRKEIYLNDLPKGSVVGCGSVRRRSQLSQLFPHLVFQDIRGNLNTRLKKLDATDSEYSCLILAYAGLFRLNMSNRISSLLSPPALRDQLKDFPHHKEPFYYAVGQGVMAVQCRENDHNVETLLSKINHRETEICILAERALMKALEGGCSVPIGCCTVYKEGKLTLEGVICYQEHYLKKELTKEIYELADAINLGLEVAQQLKDIGAEKVLAACRSSLKPSQ